MMKTGLLILFIIISMALSGCAPDKPKNIIFMISDGCGYNHVDAASLYQHGQTGVQIYEQFPVVYAMSTHSLTGKPYNPDSAWTSFNYVKRKPTDSAAAGTALATGVKTKNRLIGMDSSFAILENISERLEKYGKSTGVITSVPFYHATPAAFVAHNRDRNNYREIALEMLTQSPLDVIMGCGYPDYDDDGKITKMDMTAEFTMDSALWKQLLDGYLGNDADGDGIEDKWILIDDRKEFVDLSANKTPKRLLGVAKIYSTLQSERNGDSLAAPFAVPLIESVPTLEEMTQVALNILDEDPDGFFLMIEGGAVDWVSHANNSSRLIEEQIDFNKSVEAVVDWVEKNSSWNETLLIVTADHETGYLTGPGSNDSVLAGKGSIEDIWKPLVNNGKGQLPGMEWHSHKHTNSLVPMYAKGPGSAKFSQYIIGNDPVRGKYIDNTSIAHLIFSYYH
ncbi:MAG: alkaline phosphatase [Calditrichaceae bacterium]|nr:alkaline phosphatase [Calditrichaceae bacterium]MBN2710311.1 alkaline phosphatase [Calditrichaceae bacterium]RQV93011.1 MAG: alkaline phosphatase [Calditrichota bacterium]